ncbi:LysM peptidoglycan-binding domain-containing protein [Vagococcus intermedius]|uniref:LysM peptidoglycan-binding domain-containing protein n=1 Tax=Vagococcus intermedius TaxID=2991418 RepID=A0AAF0I8P9_9ENTE|nr:LysM peptidoglycan-binding domain-containing protein [Vagococcus intermedius]WEG74206.1 LysM peptidoglycan-binding domain-containing protein [Vagococcus intermedius]WEG76287.1 LysM peptidoglycan-binding domain-containing protein [Vagococcus intermedius]
MSVKKLLVSTAVLGGVVAGGLFASEASADSIYTVKQDDSLSKISYRLNGDFSLVDQLATVNNIKNIDLIFVGQKLNLSVDGTIKPATQEDIATKPEVANPEEAVTVPEAQMEAVVEAGPTEKDVYTVAVEQQPVQEETYVAPVVEEQPVQEEAYVAPVVEEQPVQEEAYVAPVVEEQPVKEEAYVAPVVEEQPVKEEAYVAPVVEEQPVQEEAYVAPVVEEQPVKEEAPVSNVSGSDADAKAWIAMRESTNSYTAQNGYYYGKYQLGQNLLKYGTSPEGQERAADEYVSERYGSWSNAQQFWMSNNWY